MKKLILLFSLVFLNINAQTVQYVQSEEIFNNPERGIQKYSQAKSSNYSLISNSNLTNWKNGEDKVTVLYRYFYLDTFLNSNISQTYLNNMQTDFTRIRNAGYKIIIRFAYTDNQNSTQPQPVKSQILAHIEQIKPVIQANSDVILTIQLGWIGVWGEWYYTNNSTEFGNEGNITTQQYQNRKQIVEATRNILPESFYQLRYIKAKTEMYGQEFVGNIGFYNDAFLNNYCDQGTFPCNGGSQGTPTTLSDQYLQIQTQRVPMTGETNGLNGNRTNCNNALIELDKYNWSTLNRDYHPQVWSGWIANGCKDEIVKRLGYRFVLKAITFTNSQNELTAQFNIKNVGFANTFTNRNAYLVFRNTAGQNYPYLLQTNIKQWTGDYSFAENVNLVDLPSGNYTTYLWMPDTNLSLIADYSIRLANTNVWENGYNNLNYSFVKESLGIVENNNFELFNFDKVFVYNTIGQYISDDKNLSNLPIGIYIIKGQKDDKFYTYKKIKK